MSGIFVDLFAGAGGAAVGALDALGGVGGVDAHVAINHDAIALSVYARNHPDAELWETDIMDVEPREATGGRPVRLLWASPDCTHFSVAKGDVPRSAKIRSLAWVVTRWALDVRPAVIIVENVREFQTWGPLGADGRPVKRLRGKFFYRWVRRLRDLGYRVDWRVLDASEYGAPTRRKRLFIVARCDGEPVRWPEATHGEAPLEPYRTAAQIIDWSLPCPSIFERKRPLAEKTLWRIAQGIRRYVLESADPFIVRFRGDPSALSIDLPLSTITAGNWHKRPAGAGHGLGVVVPSLTPMNADNPPMPVDEPLGTVTSQHNRFQLVTSSIIKANHGGQEARSEPIDGPLSTVTASRRGHALVASTLVQTGYGERAGQAARVPHVDKPLGTLVGGGQKHALVSAFMAKHFGGVVGTDLGDRVSTVTARDHHALAAASLVKLRGTCTGADVREPAPTISAQGNHVAEVRAFLCAYYTEGSVGQSMRAPVRTITAKHRLGLVTVEGVDYQIVDIGMRMLEPHELLAAQFGEYAAGFDMDVTKPMRGREVPLAKADRVRLIGNSVCPHNAAAVVRANVAQACPIGGGA